MIRVENLHFSFGEKPVLQEINLQIDDGEIISVLGPNGCGKSTLLRLLRGVLPPTEGQVLWQGHPSTRLSRKAMARLAAVVAQSTQTGFSFPVRELVGMGRFARKSSLFSQNSDDRKAVEKALALTDTLQLADRFANELSGGELQRVMLARALAQETPVLLLDEATSQLDLDHQLEFTELLLRLNRERGTTVIQVSHDLDQAAEISDRILLLADNGSPVAIGSPDNVYTPDNLKRAYRVEVKVEKNPYTGTPQTFPVRGGHNDQRQMPRVHLLCGGGSGGELMRRLHLAGCRMSVGPVNRGDSDQILATALELTTILEEPFCPISADALRNGLDSCRQADLLIVAPTCWGPGNLACLDLVAASLELKIPVILIDPASNRDFTGGEAWQQLQVFRDAGARVADNLNELFDMLRETDR